MSDADWYAMGFDPKDPGDWAAMSAAARDLEMYGEAP